MIRVCLFKFMFLTQLSTIYTEGCDSFKSTNVSASVHMDDELKFYVVNGCLEPKDLEGGLVQRVIVHSKITRLGKDSIRNLPKLEWLSIQQNSLEILEPQAFRNVPSLKWVILKENNLKEIPKDVFNLVPTISRLYLSSNKIDFIASGAFSNMESLEGIILTDNALTYWNRDWFENCPKLKYIRFSGNKISVIPRRAFASLPSLLGIDFTRNKITIIQPDAFQNLKSLVYLNLNLNGLTVLDERAFPNKIHIENLIINNNRLNYLPDKLLSKLSVGTIFMDPNPWKCQCLQRIHDWLFFTSGSVDVSSHNCRTPYGPICVVARGKACEESVDEDSTRRYIGHLRTLTQSLGLGEKCAFLFSQTVVQ
ncbi:unnamed protein product [Phaedon cochleariae]|uniref:Uncharacterized protein n=1 Tax=Phaedon cochleariae TaxID=80249 RepID=A0A9P0DFN6_PHACE|nr:unnamed protein product [Phaedon cochleariae]